MDLRNNRTNVTYKDINFEYPDGKTIECHLSFTVNLDKYPYNKLGLTDCEYISICNKPEICQQFLHMDKDANKVYFLVHASAMCDDHDEYDRTKGEHIALTRAQSKAYEVCEMFNAWISYRLIEKTEVIQSLIDNCYHASMKCIRHANELGE